MLHYGWLENFLLIVYYVYFRSAFIASSSKYMINNECIKGKEVE